MPRAASWPGLRGAYEARVGLSAERQHRRVLQEQERVGDLVRRPVGDHGVLERPGGAVSIRPSHSTASSTPARYQRT